MHTNNNEHLTYVGARGTHWIIERNNSLSHAETYIHKYASTQGTQWTIARNNSLSHAEEEKEKHKYVEKVKLPNSKWRYFYSREEYLRWLKNGKSSVNSISDKLKKGLTNWKVTYNDAKSDIKKAGSYLKTKMSSKSTMNKKVQKGISTVNGLGTMLLITALAAVGSVAIRKAAKWISKKIKSSKYSKSNGTISDREKPGYIAKVKLSNGKMRYFYSQDEYDAYLKRQKYQKDEPDFMKHVNDISENEIYSSIEDMDKVNETYDPWNPSSSTNCANCSTAYELRRRGYDVEAKTVDRSYNGKGDRVYDYFENPEKLYVFGDGETKTANEKFERNLWKNGYLSESDVKKSKSGYDYYANEHSYTAKSIEKAIKDNNPPGSRGFIDVTWKDGGAHSIVYEVDKKGQVTIKDSQTYDTYNASEIANKVSQVSIIRTDNLKLKEDVLNAVQTNTDKEREYYLDENTLHANR